MQTMKIHALGPSGAGKTVFMASLYRELQLRKPERAFFLKTDHTESLELNAIFNRMANPTESWPESSRAIKEWTFTTCITSNQRSFEPLAFTYLDYPGGILTNPNAMQDERVHELVMNLRSANGLLALLDGQALRAAMRGERQGGRFMDFELTSTLEIVQESSCPVAFAITKWDLLEGSYTLSQVRDRLMADDRFAAVIGSRSQHSRATMRLIPVSAVGSGFATLQPSGEMRKIGGAPRPHQVDMPLVAVIPDFLQYVYDEMSQRARNLIDRRMSPSAEKPTSRWRAATQAWGQKAEDNRWVGNAHRLALMMAPHARRAILLHSPALAKYMPDDPELLVDQLFRFIERAKAPAVARAENDRAQHQAELASSNAAVDSERKALELLENELIDRLEDFEFVNPESLLHGGIHLSHESKRSVRSAEG
jgi:hypothetical protein